MWNFSTRWTKKLTGALCHGLMITSNWGWRRERSTRHTSARWAFSHRRRIFSNDEKRKKISQREEKIVCGSSEPLFSRASPSLSQQMQHIMYVTWPNRQPRLDSLKFNFRQGLGKISSLIFRATRARMPLKCDNQIRLSSENLLPCASSRVFVSYRFFMLSHKGSLFEMWERKSWKRKTLTGKSGKLSRWEKWTFS